MSQPVSQDDIQNWFRENDMGSAFDAIYRNARDHGSRVPWDDRQPAVLLVEWADHVQLAGSGQRALVVGCGLGDDAEYLATLGFAVTAFDISPTAITLCQQRWPQTKVTYTTADVTQLPAAWYDQFDFVLESRTLQAMTWQHTAAAIRNIAVCVRPSGTLLVLCLGRDPHEEKRGIPWPLSREELALFNAGGLIEQSFEDIKTFPRRFRIHYQKENRL